MTVKHVRTILSKAYDITGGGIVKAAISTSEFRGNVYRLLDRVAETGTPLIIARKGRNLRVVCDRKDGRLARLVRRDCLRGDPEDIVHMDWSGEWNRDLP